MPIADRMGAFLGGAAGAALQSGGLPIIGQVQNVLSQGANRIVPSQLPSYDQITRLYYQGFLEWDEALDWLRSLGVGANVTGQGAAARTQLWQNVIRASKPVFPIDILFRQWSLDKKWQTLLKYELQRHGFSTDATWELFSTDSDALSVDLILQLLARGIIDDTTALGYLRHAGFNNDDFINRIKQQSHPVDLANAITLLNRGILNVDDLTKYQKWNGFRDESVQKQLAEMRWQWPSLTQVIQWGQLGVFNDDRATALQLDTETPDNYFDYARATGSHWNPADTPPQNYPDSSKSPAELSWRAHWRPNDIGTAVTMLHRLRSTGGPNGGPRVPGVTPYTQDDFNADLSANGIPPGRRDQLKAITYSLPRFTVFKSALSAGTIDKAGVIEQLQDVGYAPDTAALLADTWEHQGIQKQVDKLRPISLSQVKEAYRLGTISRNDAARGLYIIYLSDYQQIINYLALPAVGQYSLALGNGFVNLALTSIDADIAGELAKQAIEVIRKGYMRLEIDASQATSALSQLGIVPQRAQQYVQLWVMEHAAAGLEATAATLKGWYLDHLIDQPTYTTRLLMLGYSTGDVALMVARANLDLAEKAAKLQAQSVKAQGLAAKQLMAASKAAAAQQKAIQRTMCSSSTRNQVATYAIKGFITYADAYERLKECGMSGDDPVNFLASKQPKKGGLTRDQIIASISSEQTANGTSGTSAAAK